MSLRKRSSRCIAWMTVLLVFPSGVALSEQAFSDSADRRLSTQIEQALDSQFESAQHTDEIFPGATVAVALPDGTLVSHASGYADQYRQFRD